MVLNLETCAINQICLEFIIYILPVYTLKGVLMIGYERFEEKPSKPRKTILWCHSGKLRMSPCQTEAIMATYQDNKLSSASVNPLLMLTVLSHKMSRITMDRVDRLLLTEAVLSCKGIDPNTLVSISQQNVFYLWFCFDVQLP